MKRKAGTPFIDKPKTMPLCKCGCRKRITWKPAIRYNGMPEYIPGHNTIQEIKKQNRKGN